ncbi:MAG: uroporphyrinogen-III synthase [Cyclobacteriaceae bacterium]|nr:uroporphyrinogen-III synthase [Cyclobacteriaceae bacterium]
MSTDVRLLSTKTLSAGAQEEATRLGFALTQIDFIHTEKIEPNNWLTSISPTEVYIFTSARAVKAAAEAGINLSKASIAALSGATQQALHDLGLTVLYTADRAKSLTQEIINGHARHVTFFCGDKHRNELPESLMQHGVDVSKIVVYRTELTPHVISETFDGVLFFSPSAVQSFLWKNTISPSTSIFCIGNTTAREFPATVTNTLIISPVPDPCKLLRMAAQHFLLSGHVKE